MTPGDERTGEWLFRILGGLVLGAITAGLACWAFLAIADGPKGVLVVAGGTFAATFVLTLCFGETMFRVLGELWEWLVPW
jgi:hypothetical protein